MALSIANRLIGPATTTTASPTTTANTNTNMSPYAATGSFWKRWLLGGKKQQLLTTTASLTPRPASAFDVRTGNIDPSVAVGTGGRVNPQDAGAPAAAPAVDNQTPFAFGDLTWMNAVSRNHDSVLDGKYFSPDIRTDTNYIYDLNHPSITLSVAPRKVSEPVKSCCSS